MNPHPAESPRALSAVDWAGLPPANGSWLTVIDACGRSGWSTKVRTDWSVKAAGTARVTPFQVMCRSAGAVVTEVFEDDTGKRAGESASRRQHA